MTCFRNRKGRPLADAKSAKPLCFSTMSYAQVKHDYTQTPLTSVDQYMDLELEPQQARGPLRSQTGILDRGLVEGGPLRGQRRWHFI